MIYLIDIVDKFGCVWHIHIPREKLNDPEIAKELTELGYDVEKLKNEDSL